MGALEGTLAIHVAPDGTITGTANSAVAGDGTVDGVVDDGGALSATVDFGLDGCAVEGTVVGASASGGFDCLSGCAGTWEAQSV